MMLKTISPKNSLKW